MTLTADDVQAAERYLASPEATPDGIRKVKRWLELEWGSYIEQDYKLWLSELFPAYLTAPLAPHQHDFWKHIWGIQPGVRPQAWFSIWGRGLGKVQALSWLA